MGIFSMVPPTEPCVLRSTQPLKVSTRDFSWGRGGQCIWLTTYHPCSAETWRKSGALIYPEPLGATSACRGTPLLYCTWWWLGFSGVLAWRFKLPYVTEPSIWSLRMIMVKPLPGMCRLWDVLCSVVWYIHLCCWCDVLTQVKRNFVKLVCSLHAPLITLGP